MKQGKIGKFLILSLKPDNSNNFKNVQAGENSEENIFLMKLLFLFLQFLYIFSKIK